MSRRVRSLLDRIIYLIRNTPEAEVRAQLAAFPNQTTDRCWIAPRIMKRGQTTSTVIRVLLEEIAGTPLHPTHMTKRICNTDGCCHPLHHRLVHRIYGYHWEPEPFPPALQSLVEIVAEETDVEDAIDCILAVEGGRSMQSSALYDHFGGVLPPEIITAALEKIRERRL